MKIRASLNVAGGLMLGIAVSMFYDMPSHRESTRVKISPAVAAPPGAGPLSASPPQTRIDYDAMRRTPNEGALLKQCSVYLAARAAAHDPDEAARLLAVFEGAVDGLGKVIIEGLADGNPEWVLTNLFRLRNHARIRDAANSALVALASRNGMEACKAWYPTLPDDVRPGVIQTFECLLAARNGEIDRLSRYNSRVGSGGEMDWYLVTLLLHHPDRLPEVQMRPGFRVAGGQSTDGPTAVDILLTVAGTMPPDAFLKWAAATAAAEFPSALLIAGRGLAPAELISQCRTAAGGDLRVEIDLANSVARDLARRDVNAGLKWLAELEATAGEGMRSQVMSASFAFACEWVLANRAQALEAAQAAGGGAVMAEQIVRAAVTYNRDARAAVDLAAAIGDGRLRTAALKQIVHVYGQPGMETRAILENSIVPAAVSDELNTLLKP